MSFNRTLYDLKKSLGQKAIRKGNYRLYKVVLYIKHTLC